MSLASINLSSTSKNQTPLLNANQPQQPVLFSGYFTPNHSASALDSRLLNIINRFICSPAFQDASDSPTQVLSLLQQVVKTMKNAPNSPLNQLEDIESQKPQKLANNLHKENNYNLYTTLKCKEEMAALEFEFLKLAKEFFPEKQELSSKNLGNSGPGALLSHLENELKNAHKEYDKIQKNAEQYNGYAIAFTFLVYTCAVALVPLLITQPLPGLLCISVLLSATFLVAGSRLIKHYISYTNTYPAVRKLFQDTKDLQETINEDRHLDEDLKKALIEFLDDILKRDFKDMNWIESVLSLNRDASFNGHHTLAGLKKTVVEFLFKKLQEQVPAENVSPFAELNAELRRDDTAANERVPLLLKA